MRYMVFVKMAENVGSPPPALYEAMGKEMESAFAAGSIIDAGGLGGAAKATEIRLAAGEMITTNGPWTEATEVAGGYSILEVRSHEEAVEAARRVIEIHKDHWPGWEGSAEVRPISGGPDS
jgi:hypothetical protein